MALTEVWWRGVSGEWARTTASEADKEFNYTVSVNSNMFRCYKCFQYVTFVKPNNRTSFFRHNGNDIDKNCEDRSINQSTANLQQVPLSEFPLRLLMDGSSASLFLGLPPVDAKELMTLSKQNAVLTITCGQYSPAIYRVDPSRFIPNTTNWFPLTLTAQFRLAASIKPQSIVPKLWKLPIPHIPNEGALFDASTGRRICEKGDVQVGKQYYLLRSRIRSLHLPDCDISIRSFPQNSYWNVYKICALRMSDTVSAFFFDELRMRLTQQPSDIDILWPPVVQNFDVIDTKRDRLWVYVRGEQDMQTYPITGAHVSSRLRISPTQKIYEIRNSGSLQMICAERYSQTLQCLYVRPPIAPSINPISCIRITDGDDNEVTETMLKKVPSGKTLRFLSAVDGSISVSDEDGVCYRKVLPAEQETRITDLKKGLTITLRQGCAIVGHITIAKPSPVNKQFDDIAAWVGPLLPYPSRFAGILRKISTNSQLYQRTQQALRNGFIPQSGYYQLLRLMED